MKKPSTQAKQTTILHVEDDPALSRLVRTVFESLGFHGDILQVGLVQQALAVLAERERDKAPLDLVLVDMQLPDGNGLEVLQEVKGSLTWSMTPVIVLSGETAPDLINEAYALGANCYLPKNGRPRGIVGSVQALYHCWMEGALLPHPPFADLAQEALARGIRLRARTARFFLELARSCPTDPDQEKFWIERSLVEGNKSNLLAFFQGQVFDRNVPPQTGEHTIDMQRRIEKSLETAEELLTHRDPPTPADISRIVLDLMEAADEDVMAEAFGALFPKNPTVAMALKTQAAGQLKELAGYVLKRASDPDLRRRADAVVAVAGRLATLDVAGTKTSIG